MEPQSLIDYADTTHKLLIVLLASRLIVLIAHSILDKIANEQEKACIFEEGEEVILSNKVEFFYMLMKLGNSVTFFSMGFIIVLEVARRL
jgi:hypothetical protein